MILTGPFQPSGGGLEGEATPGHPFSPRWITRANRDPRKRRGERPRRASVAMCLAERRGRRAARSVCNLSSPSCLNVTAGLCVVWVYTCVETCPFLPYLVNCTQGNEFLGHMYPQIGRSCGAPWPERCRIFRAIRGGGGGRQVAPSPMQGWMEASRLLPPLQRARGCARPSLLLLQFKPRIVADGGFSVHALMYDARRSSGNVS